MQQPRRPIRSGGEEPNCRHGGRRAYAILLFLVYITYFRSSIHAALWNATWQTEPQGERVVALVACISHRRLLAREACLAEAPGTLIRNTTERRARRAPNQRIQRYADSVRIKRHSPAVHQRAKFNTIRPPRPRLAPLQFVVRLFRHILSLSYVGVCKERKSKFRI